MRENICHYANIIDDFAPCIVLSKVWNDDAKMSRFCNTSDQKMWSLQILSVSDEAFLLLVLINYTKRWIAEISRKIKEVSVTSQHMFQPASLKQTLTPITQTFHTKDAGSWTEEDELAMPVSSMPYFDWLFVPFHPQLTLIPSPRRHPIPTPELKEKTMVVVVAGQMRGKLCTMIFFAEYSRTGQCMGKRSIRSF
jgi:hypothetical protein